VISPCAADESGQASFGRGRTTSRQAISALGDGGG